MQTSMDASVISGKAKKRKSSEVEQNHLGTQTDESTASTPDSVDSLEDVASFGPERNTLSATDEAEAMECVSVSDTDVASINVCDDQAGPNSNGDDVEVETEPPTGGLTKVEDAVGHISDDAAITGSDAADSQSRPTDFSGGTPLSFIFACPEVTPSDFSFSATHRLLIDKTAFEQGVMIPHPNKFVDRWQPGYVRMPCSASCRLRVKFAVKAEHSSKPDTHKSRVDFSTDSHWERVTNSLSGELFTVDDLIAAIESYDPGFLDAFGKSFRSFFNNYLRCEERANFFSNTLPKLQKVALGLPEIVTQPIKLLAQSSNESITLSKYQIASLLANCFLNTFPCQDKELPRSQNFRTMFLANRKSCFEKMRCLLNYFDRVLNKEDMSSNTCLVSFHRRCLKARPQWEKIEKKLSRCHVSSQGRIEDQRRMLQVDFANQFVGGGVLGQGCVQEEIRFITHPELIVSRLFTPRLLDDECLIVQGAERYCNFRGYAESFEFVSDYTDPTGCDRMGRKLVTVVAIDATPFRSREQKVEEQFKPYFCLRELYKAYIGFKSPDLSTTEAELTAVATGNWGCGAFGGNTTLKFLLQWMAASLAGRDMVYLTFNNPELAESLAKIVDYMLSKPYSVGQVWKLLCLYTKTPNKSSLMNFILGS